MTKSYLPKTAFAFTMSILCLFPGPALSRELKVNFPLGYYQAHFQVDDAFTDEEFDVIKTGITRLAEVFETYYYQESDHYFKTGEQRKVDFIRESASYATRDIRPGEFGQPTDKFEDEKDKDLRLNFASLGMMGQLGWIMGSSTNSRYSVSSKDRVTDSTPTHNLEYDNAPRPIKITKYDADDGTAGKAYVKLITNDRLFMRGPFEIQLNAHAIRRNSSKDVWAGVIFHELMHQAGYLHPQNNFNGSLIYEADWAIRRGLKPVTKLDKTQLKLLSDNLMCGADKPDDLAAARE